MRPRDRRGFTILEAVIALAIVGLAGVAALEALGGELRATDRASSVSTAAALAQDRIAALAMLPALGDRPIERDALAHPAPHAARLVARERVGEAVYGLIERREERRAAAEQDAEQPRGARGEHLTAEPLHDREAEQQPGAGPAAVVAAARPRPEQREAHGEGDQQRPRAPERCRDGEYEGRGARQSGSRAPQQLGEARQHEEREHAQRDRARGGENQGVDRERQQSGAQPLFPFELLGEPGERAAQVTAPLAGADQAAI